MYKVAVIGAGAAGLCALRHLSAHPELFQPVAFEQMNEIGGTWVYTEQTGSDSQGRSNHSSMYDNLLTNLPKEVMGFPDFTFEDLHPEWPSFISHKQVLKYLQEYTQHFKLEPFIRFNTSVVEVKPVQKDSTNWEITSKDENLQETCTENYHAVFICNGHYSQPSFPEIPGIETFTGEIIHSHNYRHPESYIDKTVLLLGAGPSGQDIALDLAPLAKQVILSHNHDRLQSPLPSNMKQTRGIKRFVGTDVVLLDDDSRIDGVDVIMYCTGYEYTFPFLSADCQVTVRDNRVYPLYKHLINISHPTQFLIGICSTICPFPHFDFQIRFAIGTLGGAITLPDTESMKADIEADYRWRREQIGWPHRYAHKLGNLQWAYIDELAEISGITTLKPVVGELYEYVHKLRRTVVSDYKQYNFELKNDKDFTQLESK
ncbi:uncharacterized protein LOC141903691 isoform X2 [Tubulanus polymorphus]